MARKWQHMLDMSAPHTEPSRQPNPYPHPDPDPNPDRNRNRSPSANPEPNPNPSPNPNPNPTPDQVGAAHRRALGRVRARHDHLRRAGVPD